MAADPILVAALRNRKSRSRKPSLNVAPVHPPKSPDVTYRKSLDNLVKQLAKSTEELIFPLLTEQEAFYVTDTPRQDAIAAIGILSEQYSSLDTQAALAAETMVKSVSNTNAQRMQAAFESSMGINLPNIINDEGLTEVLDLTVLENIDLIQSIPDKYFIQLQKIVTAGITDGRTAGNIRNQVRDLFGVTDRRAKFIARDQVSKLNGNITELRHTNLGITQYTWQTREDDKVRTTHAANEGKVFSYSNPPPQTGNPGQDYNCRCVAIPVINL